MKTFLKIMIPLTLWLLLLFIIGESIDKRWGGDWGWIVPSMLFVISLKSLIETLRTISHSKDTQIQYTPEEEIEKDLNEGRD